MREQEIYIRSYTLLTHPFTPGYVPPADPHQIQVIPDLPMPAADTPDDALAAMSEFMASMDVLSSVNLYEQP